MPTVLPRRTRLWLLALCITLLGGCIPGSYAHNLSTLIRQQLQAAAGMCLSDPGFFFPQRRPAAAAEPIDERLAALASAGLVVASNIATVAASHRAQTITLGRSLDHPGERLYELTTIGSELFTAEGSQHAGGRFCIGRPDIDAIGVILRRAFDDRGVRWAELEPWARTLRFRTAFPEVDHMIVPGTAQITLAIPTATGPGDQLTTLIRTALRPLRP